MLRSRQSPLLRHAAHNHRLRRTPQVAPHLVGSFDGATGHLLSSILQAHGDGFAGCDRSFSGAAGYSCYVAANFRRALDQSPGAVGDCRSRLPPISSAPFTLPTTTDFAVVVSSLPTSWAPRMAPRETSVAASSRLTESDFVVAMAPSAAPRPASATSPPTSRVPLMAARTVSLNVPAVTVVTSPTP